jgi:hypothetical protein
MLKKRICSHQMYYFGHTRDSLAGKLLCTIQLEKYCQRTGALHELIPAQNVYAFIRTGLYEPGAVFPTQKMARLWYTREVKHAHALRTHELVRTFCA